MLSILSIGTSLSSKGITHAKTHYTRPVFSFTTLSVISGENVTYQVDGMDYEGYWSEASDQAPLVLLIHDWDGLTDYEKKRFEMLNELGYNVFAIDLFGKGIRPTEVKDKKQHTG